MTARTFNHEEFHSNIKKSSNWARLAYMLLFGVLLHVAGVVMWAVCVVQFLFVLGTGSDNAILRDFAKTLTLYIQQALAFVSYNTEDKPFPFGEWPKNTVNQREESISGVVIEKESNEIGDEVSDTDTGPETDNR